MFERSNRLMGTMRGINGTTAVLSALVLSCVLISGCGGGGDFDTSPVYGTVTFNGQPVTEGTIDFLPVPGTGEMMQGKPSSARVTADGTYKGSTYSDGDGVVPGLKRVHYSAPLPEDTRENANKAPSPYTGMAIEPSEVEVKPGKNELNFILVEPKK